MTPPHSEGQRSVGTPRSSLHTVALGALRALVTLMAATEVAALWLSFIDRAGVLLVGGYPWCGWRGLLLIYSCHAGTALPLVATLLAFRALPERFATGAARYAVRFAGAAIGAVAAWILFVDLPLDNVIPPKVAFSMPFVGAIAGGYASTLRASNRRRTWAIVFTASVSFFAGMVDATVFPTLVAATHLRVHVVTVAAGVLGVGVPAGVWLAARARGERSAALVIPATALVVTAGVGIGLGISLSTARGFVGAASPLIARLLPQLPLNAPRNVLRRMLTQPRRPAPASAARAVVAEARPSPPRSVILITVDALRADALRPGKGRGAYMRPNDTPFVDSWLERAIWFDAAYSPGTSTVDSLRSLMRGINADDPHEGANVATLARHLGLKSLAVIPPLLREDALYQVGVSQFERAELYDLAKQEQQVDHVDRLLSELKGEPFFLWTHFFANHDPYYSLVGPREQKFFTPPTAVGQLAEEYRESVGWLDTQLARLARSLEERGLRESTLVVLTADHGEHVADGLIIGHGDALHEADIRVPLVFDVPGWPSSAVPTVVSSRDILPTIVDLLGQGPEPAHRGSSLAPLMQGRRPTGPRVYPLRGFLRSTYGLLSDDDLLVYSTGLAAFQRFTRSPAVTSGRGDLLGRDPASDRTLMLLLAEYEPHPFASELGKAATAQLLAGRLAGLDGNDDPGWVDALLRIAQHTRTPDVMTALDIAYTRTMDLDAKLRLLTGVFAFDERRWSRHIEALVRGARSVPEEIGLVRAVDHAGLARGVSTELGAERLGSLRRDPHPELARAWLSLLGDAPRSPALLPELTVLAVVMNLETAEREETLLLLRAVEALALPTPRPPDAALLASLVRPLLASQSERVARAACLAMGAIGDLQDADRVSRLAMEAPRVMVRRAAVQATTRLFGAVAMPSLREWSLVPDIAAAALAEIGKLGGKPELDWLKAEFHREDDVVRITLILQTIADLRRRGVPGA